MDCLVDTNVVRAADHANSASRQARGAMKVLFKLDAESSQEFHPRLGALL